MATGFHGFHVIVGTIFLAVCLFRAMKGHFTTEQHFGFEAAAWYWHFVDVVWLFLFIFIYWYFGAWSTRAAVIRIHPAYRSHCGAGVRCAAGASSRTGS